MNTSARPIKQKKKWNILVIVLAVVLAALLAALAFAGNYLFTYALDPTAQGTMLNPADSGQPQEPSAEQQWFDASWPHPPRLLHPTGPGFPPVRRGMPWIRQRAQRHGRLRRPVL